MRYNKHTVYPCIETSLEFLIGEEYYRLWIDEKDFVHRPYAYQAELRDFKDLHPTASLETTFKYIKENLPKVNAAQIRNTNDDGSLLGKVVYYIDFSEDIRG